MKKNNNKNLFLIVAGGILAVIITFFAIKFATKKGNNSPSEKTLKPLNELSDKELEECLLENPTRRLELQKYFVFNLGKEVKTGDKCRIGSFFITNIREVTPSLSNHLTRLIGSYKKFILFQGQYYNEDSPEWKGDSLDQKINSDKEWFIIFDKTKINEDTCNYFAPKAGTQDVIFLEVCTLAVENKDSVWIAKSKSEALEIIKTDPALAT